MKKTLKVDPDILETLKFLKWAFKVKTYDDVLNKLILQNAKILSKK